MSSAPESRVPAPVEPASGGAAAAAPRRRRRPWLIVLAVLLVLLLGVAAAVALYVSGLARSVDDGVQRFDSGAFPAESLRPSATDDGEAVNFLLLGEDAGAEGRGDEGRSDTMMWVHVPADRQDVQVVSIMRDLWVDVPGHGEAKINAAYQYGQEPLAVATVEQLLGARVDHVVAVDLAGFEGLVDALGGVTVDNPQAFHTDILGGHDFAAGSIRLDGTAALAYARERHAFTDGDFTRVQNQQRLVKAIIAQLASTDTLTSPGRIQDAVSAFSPYLTFDDELDSAEIGSLAWSLRGVRGADVQTSTIPTAGVAVKDGADVVLPDQAAIDELGERIRTDTLDAGGTP